MAAPRMTDTRERSATQPQLPPQANALARQEPVRVSTVAPQTQDERLAKAGNLVVLTHPTAQAQLEALLGRGETYERLVAEVLQAAYKNPELMQCTKASLVTAVSDVLIDGLIIGRTAHLVPFNVNVAPRGEPKRWEKRAQRITDYKGKVELVLRAGLCRDLDAHCRYEHEPFTYKQGTHPIIDHEPITNPAKRGKLVGAYAVAYLPGGRIKVRYMDVTEIDAIRRQSKNWAQGECPPWYAMKTVVHQIAKYLVQNVRIGDGKERARLQQMMERMDREEPVEEVEQEAVVVHETTVPPPERTDIVDPGPEYDPSGAPAPPPLDDEDFPGD